MTQREHIPPSHTPKRNLLLKMQSKTRMKRMGDVWKMQEQYKTLNVK